MINNTMAKAISMAVFTAGILAVLCLGVKPASACDLDFIQPTALNPRGHLPAAAGIDPELGPIPLNRRQLPGAAVDVNPSRVLGRNYTSAPWCDSGNWQLVTETLRAHICDSRNPLYEPCHTGRCAVRLASAFWLPSGACRVQGQVWALETMRARE